VHDRRQRPNWIPSRRRVEWSNGAVAEAFSAEDPESLRGPQFSAAWADEIAKWRHPREACRHPGRHALACRAGGQGYHEEEVISGNGFASTVFITGFTGRNSQFRPNFFISRSIEFPPVAPKSFRCV
jgi:hypothetical protein